jgi:hypothetical protein
MTLISAGEALPDIALLSASSTVATTSSTIATTSSTTTATTATTTFVTLTLSLIAGRCVIIFVAAARIHIVLLLCGHEEMAVTLAVQLVLVQLDQIFWLFSVRILQIHLAANDPQDFAGSSYCHIDSSIFSEEA